MSVRLGFAFSFEPGQQEKYALMLCRSIRLYGGKQKAAPIFALIPNYELGRLQEKIRSELIDLGVEIIPFEFSAPTLQVYYAVKSVAAGAAEMYAMGKVEQLIYCDADSLFLNDPSLMLLDRKPRVGIRPVDIKNIGQAWDEPVNHFWKLIYELLMVPEHNIFPVISTVDYIKLRAYFNACLLTVKPEYGLLQQWSANFIRLAENPVWNDIFLRDNLYRVFLHQAILTGTLLSELTEDEMEIYSIHINFPLYTYPKHPHKPEWINDLVTCRLDMLENDNCWKNWLPMREPLRSWLLNQYENMEEDTSAPIQI